MQFLEFRKFLVPGALRRDHCQLEMVRKAADRLQRLSFICTPGHVRISGNVATPIDSGSACTARPSRLSKDSGRSRKGCSWR